MVLRIGLAIKSFNGFQKLSEESDIQTQILTHSDIENPEFVRSDLDLIIWQPEFSRGKFPRGLVDYFRKNSKTGFAVYNITQSEIKLPRSVKSRVIEEIKKPPNKQTLKLLLYNTAIPVKSRFPSVAQGVVSEKDIPLIGDSKSLKQINDFVNVISKSRKTHCLIRGEKGTEKEYIARLIHFKSNDAGKPFFEVNCKNINPDELQLQLFGRAASLNNKTAAHQGYLELAEEGTIVLKHIEVITEELQQRLLIYLDSGSFKRLNSKNDIISRARIIAMTEFDLESFLNYKHFSRELFFRFRAFELCVSPLRNRKGDIMPMVKFYINLFNRKFDHMVTGISPEAAQKIIEYNWPGNVDELRLLIERAVLITRKGEIPLIALPFPDTDAGNNGSEVNVLGNCTLQDIERVHIKKVLNKTNGNKSRAAEILNISRTTLREKMRSFDIN
jgi:DNA-binding NtrC family response regulator